MNLVTGCAGFIGSKITELLLERGNLVIGVDNLNDAYSPPACVHFVQQFSFAKPPIHADRQLKECSGYWSLILCCGYPAPCLPQS
jgi:nucleoside-diphosphate-sugar epimerase